MKLNERTDKTKDIIHLLVTTLCDRKCPFCCNKQCDMNAIPYVTNKELRECHTLCITGGEPFEYSNPSKIALYYKKRYPNIKNIYVYTNAVELAESIGDSPNALDGIDGLSVSIKNDLDYYAFMYKLKSDKRILSLRSNRLYVFGNYEVVSESFTVFHREWQKEFTPATDSIFRRA